MKTGLYILMVLVAVSFQLLDVTSTYVALSFGGVETNEIINAVNPFQMLFLKILVGLGFGLFAAWLVDVGKHQEGFILINAYVLIYFYIVTSNLFMIGILVK